MNHRIFFNKLVIASNDTALIKFIVTLLLILLLSACTAHTPVIDGLSHHDVIYQKKNTIRVDGDHFNIKTNIVIRPAGPRHIDNINTSHKVNKILLSDNLLIAVAIADTVSIYDINQNPPVAVSSVSVQGTINDAKLVDNTLFIASASHGIYEFNLQLPAEPKLIRQLSQHSNIKQIHITDNKIYLLSNNSDFSILDKENQFHGLSSKQFEYPINHFNVQDDHCYFASTRTGITVYDCTGNQLKLVGNFKTGGSSEYINLKDNLAIVADGKIGLTILDVSNPVHIHWLGSHNKLGTVSSVIYSEGQALVKNGQRLVTLNIKNPKLPITASFYKSRQAINDLAFNQDMIAYIANDTGIERIDFRQLAKVQISNEGINHGGSRRAFIKDGLAYVADWFSGLHIYDISDPMHLQHIGNYHTPGSSKGVVVKDGFAFVGDDDHGLQILDVGNPRKPVRVAEMALTGLAYTMKLMGDLLYLADHRGGFHIIDISNPKSPKHLSAFDTNGKSWAIDVNGDFAYVADDSSGLLIFDISDSSTPRIVADFDPQGDAEDVLVNDNIAYVTFFDNGLFLVDITNPHKPTQLSHLPIPGNARSIKIDGDYAYIAGWESGLVIVDINDKNNPTIVSYLDTNGSAWGADIYKGYSYIWDWWGGIKVVDVRDPAKPKLVSQYQASDTVNALSAQGNYLFSANGSTGLQSYDINNPLNPIWATGIQLAGKALDIATTSLNAYIATTEGISVVDISEPFDLKLTANYKHKLTIRSIQASDRHVFTIDSNNDLSLWSHQQQNIRPKSIIAHDVLDVALTQDKLTAVTKQGLRIFTITGDTITASHTIKFSHNNFGLISADQELLAVTERNKAVHIFRLNHDSINKLASIPFDQIITDLQLIKNRVYVYDAEQGLQVFDISTPERPALKNIYPATGEHTRFTVLGDNAFFAGETSIASVDLLAEVSTTVVNAKTMDLTIPANMPLGRYELGIYSPGEPVIWSKAYFEVTFSKRKSPKFTMEKFKQILQRQSITH